MKIALFGGAFDPPHVGHKIVAQSLVKNQVVDQVWFVPVYIHPWAKSLNKEEMTQYEHRVKMVSLLCNNESIFVNEYKDVSFTFDTLEFFQQNQPEDEFSWVMGSEYLSKFDQFLEGHPGLVNYTFYVYPRYGYELDQGYKKDHMVFLSDMPEIEASSTLVRQTLQDSAEDSSEKLSKLLDEKVFDYISKNRLYR